MTYSGVGKCRQVASSLTLFFFHSVQPAITMALSLRKSFVFPNISLFDQVGISESGIDEAVQKLVARG